MERKIFLEQNRSRFSVNAQNSMGVDLESKFKLMHDSGLLGNFSQLEQYNRERDDCSRYRMVFVVNPICSNVLFNMRTEVVKGEGSDNPIILDDNGVPLSSIKYDGGIVNYIVNSTSPVTREQAIKDTEYSHRLNGGFVYHCGTDIFNNHMLRSDGFVHVNKAANNDAESRAVYNTIEDYLRDGNGVIVENVVNPVDSTKRKIRLYSADTSLPFKRAYLTRIKEKDGWIGFLNPGTIDIPNSDLKDELGNPILINQMLANNKPCEFIDMYPDRSLFSFIPKYNKFRNRPEKNWDYCITYPFEKDTEMLNAICGGKYGAIRANFEVGHNGSAVETLYCRSLLRHTIKSGDQIVVYYYDGEVFKNAPVPVKVVSVGDYDGANKEWYFSIRKSDISRFFDKLDGCLYYKKVSNGAECEYYFRKYKKIKAKNGGELKSDINKLAFGENIYGDRVAQLMFLDDIDLNGLIDHMGRPVSELYLTILKRNAGKDKWGGSGSGDSDVEFSHCFGDVTAGLDFGVDPDTQLDYNIRYLHNVTIKGDVIQFKESVLDAFGETIANHEIPKKVESGITIANDVFYGDIVEFDPYMYEENEISPVLHRFNTVQRETNSENLRNIWYDKLESDVYDLDEGGGNKGFRVSRKNYSEILKNGQNIVIPGNIRPEGYFYNPNTKISVRENSTEVTRIRAKLVNYGQISCTISGENTIVRMKAPTSYNFLRWDYIAFHDGISNVVWGKITDVDGLNITLEVEGKPFGNTASAAKEALLGDNRKFRAYYANETVPFYASFVKNSQEFCWRGIVPPSTMTKDMELFETPFANGRFYIEKNINFFLRRQDPFGEFGLSYAKHSDDDRHIANPMEYFNIDSDLLDLSQIYNFYNNLDNVCY